MSTIVIGLSGPSCSGKTTQAFALARIFPQHTIIHQDDYYKADSNIPIDPETGLQDWDTPHAIDFDAFIHAIDTACAIAKDAMPRQHQGAHVDEVDISPDAIEASRAMFGDRWHTNHAIIVDGFLLLTDARVMARLDVCVLITASKETLAQRRAARTGYVTLEGFWQDPPGYFDKIVWPNYLRYHQWILEKISDTKSTCPIELDDPQLLVVNTEEASPETVLHQLVQYITQRI